MCKDEEISFFQVTSNLADKKAVVLKKVYLICKAVKPVVNHNLCTKELADINTLVRESEAATKSQEYFASDVKGFAEDFDVYNKEFDMNTCFDTKGRELPECEAKKVLYDAAVVS